MMHFNSLVPSPSYAGHETMKKSEEKSTCTERSDVSCRARGITGTASLVPYGTASPGAGALLDE